MWSCGVPNASTILAFVRRLRKPTLVLRRAAKASALADGDGFTAANCNVRDRNTPRARRRRSPRLACPFFRVIYPPHCHLQILIAQSERDRIGPSKPLFARYACSGRAYREQINALAKRKIVKQIERETSTQKLSARTLAFSARISLIHIFIKINVKQAVHCTEGEANTRADSQSGAKSGEKL